METSDPMFRLGDEHHPWKQSQIDEFMNNMEGEVFDHRPENRGRTRGRVTEIVRENSEGDEEKYVRDDDDGTWMRVE